MNEKILTIDVSSKAVKIGLVNASNLETEAWTNNDHVIVDEDMDGFAKHFDMDDLWKKITDGINEVLQKFDPDTQSLIGISTCAQRIAVVFMDSKGEVIYGGPNKDVRGLDSAYLIDDEFTDEEMFELTGHSPNLVFCLARLLWYQEEDEDQYEKIHTVFTLDDWLVYKLTGVICSDASSAAETQLLDIKKCEWSSKLIEAFDLNPEWFPEFVDPGSIVGNLNAKLAKNFGLKQQEIPVVKTGGDTQATLLGMGAINNGDIGISAGTSIPLHLVTDNVIIDPDCNFWATLHGIKDKWLVEANTGNAGLGYNWFKEAFFPNSKDVDSIIESYLQKIEPGADSTYAFLGPSLMEIKDQTSVKKGVFVFQTPGMILEELPTIENFAKAVLENIAFGIYENYQALLKFAESDVKTFCAGGLSKSKEFCQMLANVLNTEIFVPQYKDSAFTGAAMNVLIALKKFSDHNSIISEIFKFNRYSVEPEIADKYKSIYLDWKNIKSQVDDL